MGKQVPGDRLLCYLGTAGCPLSGCLEAASDLSCLLGVRCPQASDFTSFLLQFLHL